MSDDILVVAREQVLERGVALEEGQTLAVLQLPDDRVRDALALAHELHSARLRAQALQVLGYAAGEGRVHGQI